MPNIHVMAKFMKYNYIEEDNARNTNVELDNASPTQLQISYTDHEVKQNTTLEQLKLIQIIDHDRNMRRINTFENQEVVRQ